MSDDGFGSIALPQAGGGSSSDSGSLLILRDEAGVTLENESAIKRRQTQGEGAISFAAVVPAGARRPSGGDSDSLGRSDDVTVGAGASSGGKRRRIESERPAAVEQVGKLSRTSSSSQNFEQKPRDRMTPFAAAVQQQVGAPHSHGFCMPARTVAGFPQAVTAMMAQPVPGQQYADSNVCAEHLARSAGPPPPVPMATVSQSVLSAAAFAHANFSQSMMAAGYHHHMGLPAGMGMGPGQVIVPGGMAAPHNPHFNPHALAMAFAAAAAGQSACFPPVTLGHSIYGGERRLQPLNQVSGSSGGGSGGGVVGPGHGWGNTPAHHDTSLLTIRSSVGVGPGLVPKPETGVQNWPVVDTNKRSRTVSVLLHL
jgi:hypothetical protein